MVTQKLVTFFYKPKVIKINPENRPEPGTPSMDSLNFREPVTEPLDCVEFLTISEAKGGLSPSKPSICLDLEDTLKTAQFSGTKPLMLLVEQLAQATALIRIDQNSAILLALEETLNRLHDKMNIWTFSSSLSSKDEVVWETFLSTYLRIPEKFVAIFDSSTLVISNPRLFYRKMFQDLIEVDRTMINACTGKLLGRFLVCGFQDELCSLIVRLKEEGNLMENLFRFLPASKQQGFVEQCMASAEVSFRKDSELILWIDHALLPIFKKSDAFLSSLFQDVMKYKSLPLKSTIVLFSVILWRNLPINLAQFLIQLLKMRTPTTYDAHLCLVFLSFISGEELANNHDLTRNLVEFITARLNHAEPKVRLEAMIIAECFGRISGATAPLYFDLEDNSKEVLDLRATSILIREVDQILHHGQCCVPYKFQKPLLEPILETPESAEFDHVDLLPSVPAKPFSDLESPRISEPKRIEPRNAKLKRPKFLRDCLEYLRSEDPDKWEMALDDLPALISSAYVLEMKEFGIQVFKTLLFLSDQFKLENFEKTRLALLSSITEKLPENALRMLKCEFTGRSLNLGQKSDILTLVMCQLKSILVAPKPIFTVKNSVFEEAFALLKISDEFEKLDPGKTMDLPTMIRHFYLPLLADLHNTRSKTFLTAHDFLLEKTILCASMFLYVSGNTVEYPSMIPPILVFLRPVIDSPDACSAPIIRVTVRAFNALFASWPDHLEVLGNIEDLARISLFLQETGGRASDPETQALCSQTLGLINTVAGPRRLLAESSKSRQLDFHQLNVIRNM